MDASGCTVDAPVSIGDIIVEEKTDFVYGLDSKNDFVQFFPFELSNKLFSYLPDKDIFSCSQCSIEWRRVINNNSQWKLRCARKGWYSFPGHIDPFVWTNTLSHVGNLEFQFRPTPLFSLPSVASHGIEVLCDWAKYYRQCSYLKCNWKLGRYAIHKLDVPEIAIPTIYNTCDCNGKFFAAGTTMGYILIWSVLGSPAFVKSILAIRKRIEVETLRMTKQVMVVLCQTGILQCYNISDEVINGKEQFEVIHQIRIGGCYVNMKTYGFHLKSLTSDEMEELYQLSSYNGEDDKGLVGTQEAETFRRTPWLQNEYLVGDISLFTTSEHIVLSGISANVLHIIAILTGEVVRQLSLPLNTQLSSKTAVQDNKLYLSVRRGHPYQIADFTYHLLVYDLDQVLKDYDPKYIEFRARSMLEEVRGDPSGQRLVWVDQDSLIEGWDLITQTALFVRQGLSYIDNLTVQGETIIYHQYDGFIIGMDWEGNQTFEMELSIGIVRGLKCYDQFLISGGDSKNLSVWNNQSGILYHKVHHQPCRIEFIYADATKVITLGREDPPVLVGYW